MKTSAAYKVGELKRRNSTQHTAGPTVTELSEHQRAPKLKIYQHSKSKDRDALQKERNNILCLIYKRLKEVAVEESDILADQITSTDDCRKMFSAAKQLRSNKQKHPAHHCPRH